MTRLLMHNSLVVRITVTILSTLVLLIFVWAFSAVLLPQGVIRFNAGIWLQDLPAISSALLIFGMNLLAGACGIILMNQWHTKTGLAVGYYFLLLRSSIFHGVLRGTNSFTFPYDSHSEVILGFFRVGLWETLALCLICAATASLAKYPTSSHYGVVSFFKFMRNPAKYIKRQEIAFILAGVTLLALSALMEAFNILFF